jgi:sugar phosphate isomerase/epimerase
MFSASSRRNFLQGVPAAMAAGSLASTTAAAEPAATDIKLGIASYSFREFSRHLCIQYTKQCGITLLTIKEFHALYRSTPEELDKAKAEFQKAGLTLTGGGTVYMMKEDDDDIRFYFEYAKRLGLPMMNIGATQKTLPMIEKFAVKYNIKIALHNHGPEDKYFPAPSDALKIIKDMDPRMGVCIDIGHTTRIGKDLLSEVEGAGSRLLDMHVKDLRDIRDGKTQCPVGDGAMPIPQLFKLLKKMNYQGALHLEYEIEGDNPLLGMQKSFSYMRGVLAGMKA